MGLQGYMNLLDFFGVYGTICKETGAAFRWALPSNRDVASTSWGSSVHKGGLKHSD